MQVIIGKSLYLRRIDVFCVMTLDEDLLESLFYRYSQRMENFAAHILGDAAAAEDVVQDSFVKLYSKYRGKDEKNFVPLLLPCLGIPAKIPSEDVFPRAMSLLRISPT